MGGYDGRQLLMSGLVVCAFGRHLRPDDVLPPPQSARPSVDARGLRADLRDVQNVSRHAGQVHPAARAVHRRRDGDLLRLAAAAEFTPKMVAIIVLFSLVGIAGSYGVAWFGIRINTYANSRAAFASLRRQTLSDLRHSAAGRHQHRHAADLRRARDHARHLAVRARAITPGRASSASPSANRSERPPSGSPAAFSRKSPTSAPT